MFKPGDTRQSHYVKTAHGAKHDADIKRLESCHKANMDMGATSEPEHQSHNPNQDNYEHAHTPVVSPTIGAGASKGLKGL